MSNLVTISGTKLINLTRIQVVADTDLIVIQKNTNGDKFTRTITFEDFAALIAASSGEIIREITSSVTQSAQDDFISATGLGIVYSLLISSSASKRVTVKCELGGSNIIVRPSGFETIEGVAADRVVTPGSSITIAPITGGWSES